jgi:recombination associated protein RdgC
MWFKNIHFYRFEEPFAMNGQQLHEALAKRQARACGQMEQACEGWAKPLGHAGQLLVHETDDTLMICKRREDKILPASMVREKVEERVLTIEQEAGRPVGRKEKGEIKDQVLQELLPRALVRASHAYACIDRRDGWLIVNAASAKQADEMIALLAKTLGALNVVRPQTNVSPESAMTHWLMHDEALPPHFTLEDECELVGSGEGSSVIRCRHVEITSDEVRAHVANGKRVGKLAMNWDGHLSFVLHDDLSVRRLVFDSEVLDAAADGADDAQARFDADQAIMMAELRQFLPQLLALLAGDEA